MDASTAHCDPEILSSKIDNAAVQNEDVTQSENLVEILYSHPNIKIIAFSASGPRRQYGDNPGLPIEDEPGSLSWSSRLERTIAVGQFKIYRTAGSVAFLSCGSALQPILRKSQCWCMDENNNKFVLRIRRPQYWRIELPVSTAEEQAMASNFREVLDKILQFEKTFCPFERPFTVILPEQLDKPLQRKPWTPVVPVSSAEVANSSSRNTGRASCESSNSMWYENSESNHILSSPQGNNHISSSTLNLDESSSAMISAHRRRTTFPNTEETGSEISDEFFYSSPGVFFRDPDGIPYLNRTGWLRDFYERHISNAMDSQSMLNMQYSRSSDIVASLSSTMSSSEETGLFSDPSWQELVVPLPPSPPMSHHESPTSSKYIHQFTNVDGAGRSSILGANNAEPWSYETPDSVGVTGSRVVREFAALQRRKRQMSRWLYRSNLSIVQRAITQVPATIHENQRPHLPDHSLRILRPFPFKVVNSIIILLFQASSFLFRSFVQVTKRIIQVLGIKTGKQGIFHRDFITVDDAVMKRHGHEEVIKSGSVTLLDENVDWDVD